MKCLALLFVLLFTQAGCLAPVIRRMDGFERHAQNIEQQLEAGNEKLAENAERMRRMEEHLGKMERYLKRFGGGEVNANAPQ